MHRLIGLLLLVASFAIGALWLDAKAFLEQPLPVPDEGRIYELRPGTSVAGLAAELEREGLIERPLYLRLLARWLGIAARLQAGEYRIEPGTDPQRLLELLASGRVVQHAWTLIEGSTFSDLRRSLAAHPAVVPAVADATDAEIMQRLDRPGLHPEGRFYPDTYHFPRGTTDLKLLSGALQRGEVRLAEEWARRADGLPFATPDEALILASIIEKETGLGSERAEISGVFVRRLQRGMRLQTDPTVIYGLGERFDGNLRRADLREATAYNTYVHKGLPPTPICMPGGAALHAALHPADGDSLYFVSRGDGSHQFSATLEEHNRAVREYQLNRRGTPDGG